MKETVYVETSVISYLTARPSNDLRAMANQNTTTEWWEKRKPNYSVFVSDLVMVHEEVTALAQLGLVERTEHGGVRCPYVNIHVDLQLSAEPRQVA